MNIEEMTIVQKNWTNLFLLEMLRMVKNLVSEQSVPCWWKSSTTEHWLEILWWFYSIDEKV